MKPQLIIILLSTILSNIHAQTDVLSLYPNSRWSVSQYDGFGNYSGEIKYYANPDSYDTLINSILYKKIYVRDLSVLSGPLDGYHCSIRNDNLGQKAFIVPKDSIHEFLLYDYSKSLADTIYNIYSDYGSYEPTLSHIIIDYIDSVPIGDKYYKKQQQHSFFSTNPNFPDGGGSSVWIKSIGSLEGLLTGIMPNTVSYSHQLNCMSANDTIFFPAISIGECEIPSEILEEQDVQSLIITPNPSNGVFTVSSTQPMFNIEIYNFLMERIYSKSINSCKQLVQLNTAAKGSYCIKIVYNNKIQLTKKLIINN